MGVSGGEGREFARGRLIWWVCWDSGRRGVGGVLCLWRGSGGRIWTCRVVILGPLGG